MASKVTHEINKKERNCVIAAINQITWKRCILSLYASLLEKRMKLILSICY